MAMSMSWFKASSVNPSISKWGLAPLDCRAAINAGTKSAWKNWLGLSLKVIDQAAVSACLAQASNCRQTAFRANLPRARSEPDSSARCQNWSGCTTPLAGCCQCSSASAPMGTPAASTCTWYNSPNSRCETPRRRSCNNMSCANTCNCITGSKNRTACRPAVFALYMARSAFLSKSDAGSISPKKITTPMLAEES